MDLSESNRVVAGARGRGAFAIPHVYEYKASLKNMNLKEVKVTLDKVPYVVYMKYQKNTSLKGWLIMDQDGVTSPTIMTDRLGLLAHGYGSYSSGYDYGRNRGFLVVINPSAYKAVRRPKILPAILDAKWLDTAFTKGHAALTGPAEGYLYVGGDAVKPVRPQLDFLDSYQTSVQRSITNDIASEVDIVSHVPYLPLSVASASGDGQQGDTAATAVTNINYSGMVAIADYVWTSVYLFAGATEKDGYFNGPNWFKPGNVSPFGRFEYFWDQNLPTLLQTGWATNSAGAGYKTPVNYYHDTWMNGSGVAGKWSKSKEDGEYCCGIFEEDSFDAPILDTLSGNLKGGLFLCTENGIDAKNSSYRWFDPPHTLAWEDQFNTARIVTGGFFASPDAWQNDLWQDGFFEIETTDIITGTWSIKRASGKFFAKGSKQIFSELTEDEVKILKTYTVKKIPETVTTTQIVETTDPDTQEITETEQTINWSVATAGAQFAYDSWLWGAIKGAALHLAKTNGGSVTVFDGSEIYPKTVNQRANIPMVTPQFALYYRLVYGEYDVADIQQP